MSDFVYANMSHTLLHELAHALVSEFELPILGQEEDAADAFATIEMDLLLGDDAESALTEVVNAWLWEADEAGVAPLNDPLLFGLHDLPIQRGMRLACHFYGLDPDKNEGIAKHADLADEMYEPCLDEAINAYNGWLDVLNRRDLVRDEGEDVGVTHKVIIEGATPWATLLRTEGYLDDFAQYAAISYRWKTPFEIKAMVCDEANAFWDPETRELILCYEFLDDLVAMEARHR